MGDKLNPGQQGSAHFCNGNDSLTLSEEDSFVVLSNPSGLFTNPASDIFPPTKVGLHPVNSTNTTTSLTSPMSSSISNNSGCVTGSFSTDFSVVEIQQKLHEVLQENVSLKETLHQNNLAMRQQLATFGTWQTEVAKLHQTHKEKFLETKELILKLRTENDELKKALEDADLETNKNMPNASDTTLMTTNASLLKQVEELQNQVSALTLSAKNEQHVLKAVTSKKEQELISLTEQLNRQLEIAERSRRQLGVDAERLQAQKTKLEREVASIKTELDAQKEKISTVEMEKQKLQHMCITSEKEVEYLKTELKNHEEVIKKINIQQEQNMQQSPNKDSRKSLDQQQKKLVVLDVEPEKLAPMSSNVGSQVTSTAGSISVLDSGAGADPATIERLQTRINELQKMLEEEQALGRERVNVISGGQEQFKSLFVQYQEALQHLDEYKKNQNSDIHRNSYYEMQVRGFTEKIDCMTAQIMKLEDDVLQRNHKIAELEVKIRDLEIENETIPLLQIQMEVYQSDFNAEREARENLAGEKEQHAEDLRLLQRRNQQLLTELKQHQQNYGEQPQSSSSSISGWTTVPSSNRNHPRENTPPSPGPFDN